VALFPSLRLRCGSLDFTLLYSVQFIFATTPAVTWQDKGPFATRRKLSCSSLESKAGLFIILLQSHAADTFRGA